MMAKKKEVVRRKGATGRTNLYWPARVVAIRKRMGLSQRHFAKLIGVSVDTLQNWEQSRRQPSGPSVVLLNVLEADPESVLRALR
jgi:putative transcriptional regulator